MSFPSLVHRIPAGVCGTAGICHKVVSEEEAMASSWRALARRNRDEYIPPGPLCILTVNGQIMMSDSQMEKWSNLEFVQRAHGRVLIAGLGLGMILFPVLAKPDVEWVTVLEVNPDVITLVSPYVQHEKLDILQADVFTWAPPAGVKYSTIYFDIWPERSTDNLPEMARLHRRYARRLDRLDPAAWMGSWYHKELKAMARREARENERYRFLRERLAMARR